MLHYPILPLILLPLMRHLQQLRHLGCRLVVGGEHIIHVLLETVVVQFSPLLDLSWHLFFDFLYVFNRAVRGFERLPGVEKGDSLCGG